MGAAVQLCARVDEHDDAPDRDRVTAGAQEALKLAGGLVELNTGERPRRSDISRRGCTGLPYLSYLVDHHWSPWQSTRAFWFFTSMANSPRGPSSR
jgi:hypothetical protein